jgi:hypothetical protein
MPSSAPERGATEDSREAPLFTIAHTIEIPAAPEAVWDALVDFASYADWNPYVLRISGEATEGAVLEVTIAQDNWSEPLTIQPTVRRAEAPRVFHWRGRVGDGSMLDTDHSFHIEPAHIESLQGDGVRFVQQEEFRGSLAASLEADARRFTAAAFQAMNEALARRVTGN